MKGQVVMKKKTGEDANISSLRATQLESIACGVFGSIDAARDWLSRPHQMLDGLAPADYANNEGRAAKVKGVLSSLKHGGVV